MGFFSRFFKFKEQDSGVAETTWAMEDNGSELVLDPEYAATLLNEIDLDAALTSHTEWRFHLEDVVHGRAMDNLEPDRVCRDDRCNLGRWLHGPGRERLGHYPAFTMLVARHRYFHQQAATVAGLLKAGELQKAQQLMGGSCRHASNQVIFLLKELKRGVTKAG